MSTEELGEGVTLGSVSHAFRNRLFWHWAKAMPARMPSGFVAMLYALASAADPAGYLRFRDGRVITMEEMAAAVGTDKKMARRFVDAAVAAGVLTFEGERKRGRTTLYALVLSPLPDWGAAKSLLAAAAAKAGAAKAGKRLPAPWQSPQGPVHWDDELGGPTPQSDQAEKGGPTPQSEPPDDEAEGGTDTPWSWGDRPPLSWGDRPPNNPRVPRGSHAMADVGPQPQVARASPPSMADADPPARPVQAVFLLNLPGGAQGPEPDTPPPDFARCEACHGRLIPRPGRTTHHQHCQPETSDRDRDTG